MNESQPIRRFKLVRRVGQSVFSLRCIPVGFLLFTTLYYTAKTALLFIIDDQRNGLGESPRLVYQ